MNPGHLTLTVRYDDNAELTINRCAEAVDGSGLEEALQHAARSGRFLTTTTVKGGLVIGLSPMAELLLLEFEAMAKQPIADSSKRSRAQRVAELAGFA